MISWNTEIVPTKTDENKPYTAPMKKLITLLTIIFLLLPKHSHAQDNGAVVAGAVGALAAIGAGVAAVEQ